MYKKLTVLITVIVLLAVAGCSEKTPPRNQIKILKKRIYTLQEAIKSRNPAVIDSLLSPKILSYKESSDSLINFCYGPDGSFAFDRLGNCDIAYTHNKAVADCVVIDTAGQKGNPIHLSFTYKHKMWLLSRFDMGDTTTAGE